MILYDQWQMVCLTLCPQMQSTVREHRDRGHAGGVFSQYAIVKVSSMSLLLIAGSGFPVGGHYITPLDHFKAEDAGTFCFVPKPLPLH